MVEPAGEEGGDLNKGLILAGRGGGGGVMVGGGSRGGGEGVRGWGWRMGWHWMWRGGHVYP